MVMGKKERFFTVPDEFIDNVHIRYRELLGLTPLPHIDEKKPIMPSLKTGQPLHQNTRYHLIALGSS